MKTVNIRQSRRHFIDSHMKSIHNPYFKALAEAFKLSAGKRWDNINFTYDCNGLTYLSVENDAGDADILFSVDKKEENNE